MSRKRPHRNEPTTTFRDLVFIALLIVAIVIVSVYGETIIKTIISMF